MPEEEANANAANVANQLRKLHKSSFNPTNWEVSLIPGLSIGGQQQATTSQEEGNNTTMDSNHSSNDNAPGNSSSRRRDEIDDFDFD